MTTTLAIDCGNSRVKWGLHIGGVPENAPGAMGLRDGAWRTIASAGTAELERLVEQWHPLAAPDRIVISNVAGGAVRATVEDLLTRWPVKPVWLRAVPAACGVQNGYTTPAQLGVDRWAALVAAWCRHRGESLVVMAGTATTVDWLSAEGVFRGGMILPGVELMKKSLHVNTAALPLASGRVTPEPRNTLDAIESGCLGAQAGAIERMYARLAAGAPCFISGGAAGLIAPHLALPVREVENLVLEGIVLLAGAP